MEKKSKTDRSKAIYITKESAEKVQTLSKKISETIGTFYSQEKVINAIIKHAGNIIADKIIADYKREQTLEKIQKLLDFDGELDIDLGIDIKGIKNIVNQLKKD